MTFIHYHMSLGAWFSERSCFYVGQSQASVSQVSRFIIFDYSYIISGVKLNTVSIAMVCVRFCTYHVLGGNYAMGNYLRNAFRWSETVGPWEERPGHFNDAWGYWTDDGLGFFEFLQVYCYLIQYWPKILSNSYILWYRLALIIVG
jgi:hypothetical protein